jgi:nicotinate phosphoribosyltransferase
VPGGLLTDLYELNMAASYLRQARGYPEETLRALAALRFTGEVRAVPEGHVVFAGEQLIDFS